MRLTPLYRVRFVYPHGWSVDLTGPEGKEEQHFFLAEGRCEGRITGRFRGANYPRRRTDRTFLPDFRGVIETDDGAVILCDMRGYGRAYPEGRRQIVISATHVSDDSRYRWLNEVVCVGTGEVRSRAPAHPGDENPVDLVVDVAELTWEPIAE
ncbi:MAG: DUF3237 family protein [Armatimonadetes bacterium]|nr:DUF3237 family protein [Armatimonadota bacterium]